MLLAEYRGVYRDGQIGSYEMSFFLNKRLQQVLLIIGIGCLISSLLLFVGMVSGLTPLPEQFIDGESTVHSVARIAIVGCLLAAIGSLD